MNQCKFQKGQDVWAVSGHYKNGFSITQYVFESETRRGYFWLRDKESDEQFITMPYLVFCSEKAAHDSLVSKFTFWLERENKRYEESMRGGE